MNKKIITALTAFALQSLISQYAMAADSTITVTGNVVAAPCTVDTATKSVAIPLGDETVTTLSKAGFGGTWSKAYNLTLSNCPTATQSVNATFSGTADTADTNGYANSAAGGPAMVSIQLAKPGGTVYLKNGVSYGDTAIVDGAVSFPVLARMFTKNGSATPGAVSSAVSVAFTYK